MKKILLLALIIGLFQMFSAYQMRNADKVTPNQMYEITLIKNGVQPWHK